MGLRGSIERSTVGIQAVAGATTIFFVDRRATTGTKPANSSSATAGSGTGVGGTAAVTANRLLTDVSAPEPVPSTPPSTPMSVTTASEPIAAKSTDVGGSAPNNESATTTRNGDAPAQPLTPSGPVNGPPRQRFSIAVTAASPVAAAPVNDSVAPVTLPPIPVIR